MVDIEQLMRDAVQHFWRTRHTQSERQGSTSGVRDAGNRTAVTGGKHADGFVRMVGRLVEDAGVPDVCIHTTAKTSRTLPGYFRPAKEWDLVVLSGKVLIAVVEVKSQVGSLGNNFNNRVEEALGNATDFWSSYEKGTFQPSPRPWLGYLFMLEESADATRPTRPVRLEPFRIDSAFNGLSYAKRYEEVCRRLVRERLYDAACFITSKAETGIRGVYTEPSDEISVKNFSRSLYGHASAFAKI
jgi:hypothetical protein